MAAGDVIVVSENGYGRKGNYYDGTDDYTLHDAHAIARDSAGDTVGTYTAWIYLDNITGTKTILSAGDNNSVNEGFHFDAVGGKLRIFLHNASAATQFDVIETTAGLNARKWTHVAIVQNGTRPTLYVNGVTSAMTDTTGTDLTAWYADISVGPVDKFAIGVTETNNTHLNDFTGAIGQVKYFNIALTAAEILVESKGVAHVSADGDSGRAADIATALVFNVTYELDGITDSGSGADNGTLTGNAFYGGLISDWSYTVHTNVTGHAAEVINTILDGSKFLSLIKRGD